jgi:hypothetical protein
MAGPKAKEEAPVAKIEAVTPKLFPVKLVKNYRPIKEMPFMVMENTSTDDEPEWEERSPEGDQEVLEGEDVIKMASLDFAKVREGLVIKLPKEEAQRLLKAKVAAPFSELMDG